jgi:hypothetical protein
MPTHSGRRTPGRDWLPEAAACPGRRLNSPTQHPATGDVCAEVGDIYLVRHTRGRQGVAEPPRRKMTGRQ